ncbi:unnamed protein product [Rhizoctonia solani]|uniref:Carbonic anhydrase n=1 Tax=Rhizoctonia solani TaxID=456999 RepID=A0A8H2XUM5_9AGAM|nr:unnamed protein product [Rhizoctonia solani]CAE6435646.1 unnamed protein product [Rhizoctonia solani]
MDCRIRMKTIIKAVRPPPTGEEAKALEEQDVEDTVARTGLYILRNAGGRAQEALRSIIVSQNLLHTTDIHVVHHLGCGMANNSEEGLRETLLRELAPSEDDMVTRSITMHQLAQYQFLPIRSDICIHRAADSVFNDMELLRNHPLIKRGTNIRGWLYENIHLDPRQHSMRPVEGIPRSSSGPAPNCIEDMCERKHSGQDCRPCHANCPSPR